MTPSSTTFTAIHKLLVNSKIQPPWKDKDCLQAIKIALNERDSHIIDSCIEKIKEFGESYRKEEIIELENLKKKL